MIFINSNRFIFHSGRKNAIFFIYPFWLSARIFQRAGEFSIPFTSSIFRLIVFIKGVIIARLRIDVLSILRRATIQSSIPEAVFGMVK